MIVVKYHIEFKAISKALTSMYYYYICVIITIAMFSFFVNYNNALIMIRGYVIHTDLKIYK